jgi:hypothetical protein
VKPNFSLFNASGGNIKILIAGLAIVIATNVIALTCVAYNRSGQAEAQIELTERELAMPYRYYGMFKENTGLGLRIQCRLEGNNYYGYGNCNGIAKWFNREKLIELGFKFQPLQDESAGRYAWEKELPRKAYIVLEYDGAAYQRALASAEQELNAQQQLLDNNPDKEEFKKRVKAAKDKLEGEQLYFSRLFAIDAGSDKTKLRNTYPDSSRYLIMQALIKPSWYGNGKGKDGEWKGRITELLINTINVPLEHRVVFELLKADQNNQNQNQGTPRYKVSLAFGKRGEPWVIGVEDL